MPYPVLDVVDELREQLNREPLVILEAPPGAGKSTVLPLELLDAPWLGVRKILLLEPRRLAARAVAMRLAQLRGDEVGQTVGYRVRFENRISAATRLEVVTEGVLTRMLQHDNALEEIGLLIFDEFHERSLQADLALVLVREVQQVLRQDLKIMIMSATLDGDHLARIFNAPVIRATGKQHPVTLQYLDMPESEGLAFRVARGIKKAIVEQQGDILAFLPGTGEIRRTMSLLEQDNLPVSLFPLYGDLDFKRQQAAILPDPAGKRKVVLATSIAETSLTIEGITTVVDSGYARVPAFDPRSGFTRLLTTRVTRDAADQRTGRAGRLGPGVCYRLWSEGADRHLVDRRTPEILVADLAPLMLEIFAWGATDVYDLEWITPPPQGAVKQAVELLTHLEAVKHRTITPRGKAMLRLPTHPRIAHMLLEAKDTDDTSDLALVSDIAALLEERDPLSSDSTADLTLRIEALRRWRRGNGKSGFDRIERAASAWRRLLDVEVDNEWVAETSVGRWLLSAYPERVAQQLEKHGLRYRMANGRIGRLSDNDPLHRHEWIAIAHVDARLHEGRIFLAAPVEESDLYERATEAVEVVWDADREMVVATRKKSIGPLKLSGKPLRDIPQGEKIAVICGAIRAEGLGFLNWNDEHRNWQARVMSLRQWRPAEAWPDVSDEALLGTVETWLGPFLQQVYKRSEILKLDLTAALQTCLPWDLLPKLETLAPVRLPVPSGSNIRLQYFSDGRAPVMEVRLQEVFGMVNTPRVNDGQTRIVLHLLSPGFKPVQVTQDLRSFWTNTYGEVRKELRRRYPKHSWPEDPWTAAAVRGVRRKN